MSTAYTAGHEIPDSALEFLKRLHPPRRVMQTTVAKPPISLTVSRDVCGYHRWSARVLGSPVVVAESQSSYDQLADAMRSATMKYFPSIVEWTLPHPVRG